jgi:cytochrome c-type biogenesis protein
VSRWHDPSGRRVARAAGRAQIRMIDGSELGIAAAFLAGAVSFLSPCVLPLVPAYISYVAGQSLHDASRRMSAQARAAALLMRMFFVLGFSTVFIALWASATAISRLLLQYRYEANIVGGIIVILLGVFLLGLPGRVTWLYRDLRFHPRLAGGNPLAAYVIGLAFGFGWTPCIGPVLGAILTLSAVQMSTSSGVALLTAYAAGLGVPFLLIGVFLHEMTARLTRLRQVGRWLQLVAGGILILLGVAMITGKLTAFSYWLLDVFPVLGRIG